MLCRAVLKYKAVVLAARHVALSPASCATQWRACVTPATQIYFSAHFTKGVEETNRFEFIGPSENSETSKLSCDSFIRG